MFEHFWFVRMTAAVEDIFQTVASAGDKFQVRERWYPLSSPNETAMKQKKKESVQKNRMKSNYRRPTKKSMQRRIQKANK